LRAWISRRISANRRGIRLPPSAAALVQCGASAYALGKNVTARDADIVDLLLSSVGFCIAVEEKQLDAVTGRLSIIDYCHACLPLCCVS
jgi:pyrroline-5-carboxylate reductase